MSIEYVSSTAKYMFVEWLYKVVYAELPRALILFRLNMSRYFWVSNTLFISYPGVR